MSTTKTSIALQARSVRSTTRALRLAGLFVALLVATGSARALAAPQRQSALYTVEDGDTWVSIAFRFGVPVEDIWQGNGVANPDLLAPGQRLFIPGATTREDTAGSVANLSEASMLELAAQADTMLVTLQVINDTQWPFVPATRDIYIPDAILHLPPPPAFLVEGQPPLGAPTPQVQVPLEPLAPPIAGDANLEPLVRSQLGVQGNFLLEGQKRLLDRSTDALGVGWVKQQVLWKLYEPENGVYREEELAVLDSFVDAASTRGLRILLSVVAAPDWARPSTVNHGPPANYQDLADFMGFLAARYGGAVQAYEVWNEPNLELEWTDFPISGASYVEMLSLAYPAIKAGNPSAIVVSAGLAPASDTPISVDDRRYLREMYAAGVANYADVIGIHPYGAGNPPDASVFGNPGVAPSHNDHESFFFRDNVEAYRIIQGEYGDGRPLWATEFGWPSNESVDVQVPAGWLFMNYVTEQDQADFTYRALLMGQSWDFMGPMFIYILNFGPDRSEDDTQRAYALTDANGHSRPVYQLIQSAPKI